MADPIPPKQERVATFRMDDDEFQLFAIIRKAKRNAEGHTFHMVLEINGDGIFVLKQESYKRTALAS